MATTAHRSTLDPRWEEEAIAAISREVVRLHAQNFGSEPGNAEVTWEDDFLICMLEDALTEPEWRLIDGGRLDRVRAYMSEIDVKGAAFEAFILER